MISDRHRYAMQYLHDGRRWITVRTANTKKELKNARDHFSLRLGFTARIVRWKGHSEGPGL